MRLLFAGAGLFFRLFEKEAVDVITEPADICKVAGGQAYLHLLYLIQPLSAAQQGLAHQMKVLETDFPHILTLVSRFSSQCVYVCTRLCRHFYTFPHSAKQAAPALERREDFLDNRQLGVSVLKGEKIVHFKSQVHKITGLVVFCEFY